MTKENEVTLERAYNYPINTVWDAWTNSQELKQWWGPDNVTISECEVDLRVDGKFYIVMEAGEAMGPYKGTLWPMDATFTTVDPHEQLAYDAIAWTDGQRETTTIEQTTEILFAKQDDGGTKVTVHAVIHKAGSDAQMAVQGMKAGFSQQMEKLNEYLKKERAA